MGAVWQDYAAGAIRELYPRSRRDVDYFWGRRITAPDASQAMLADNYPGGINMTTVQTIAEMRMALDPNAGVPPTPPGPAIPDATNTGPRIALTDDARAHIQTTAAGQTIQGLRLTNGFITILHNNCSVIDCEINSQDYFGIDADNMTGTTISYCEIKGIGGSAAIVLAGGTADHNDLSGYENGILFGGADMNILNNFIHGLSALSGSPHYDGMQTGGANNVLIQYNRIDNDDTSNVFLKNDYGIITNVRVLNNWMSGDVSGNVCVYNEGTSGAAVTAIQVKDNIIFAPPGTGGIVSVSPGLEAQVTQSNNVVQ